MSPGDKLKVIIMRDDSRVRRYSIRVLWLRVFIYLQVLLLLTVASGIYLGITHWNQLIAFEKTNKVLQDRITEQSLQLTRLQHIQASLNNNDPEEMQVLFSTVSRERQKSSSVLNLQDIFLSKDLQMAGVANMQLSNVEDGLSIDFELNNLSKQKLVGRVSAYFITREGTVIEAVMDANSREFEIQRFVNFNAPLQLPTGLPLETIFALRVVITESDGEDLFIHTYPLNDILIS